MRSFLLLCISILLGTLLQAQNFEVISSYPSNGTENVQTDSVILSFNQPVVLNEQNPFESQFYFSIEPASAVEISSFELSEDGSSVKIYGDFATDTDFIAFLAGAKASSGDTLSKPYVFQFTTAASAGSYVVTGTLTPEMLKKVDDSPTGDFIVFLSSTKPTFDFFQTQEEEQQWNNNNDYEEDDTIIPVVATLTNSLTGEFVLSGVREGSYFPLGLNMIDVRNGMDQNYENEIMPPYFFDPNNDFDADSIIVNATTAPNDTLKGIDLEFWDLSPFTFTTAKERATTWMDQENIIGYTILGGKATDGEFFPSIYDGFTPIFGETPQMEEEPYILKGSSNSWVLFGYHAAKDSVAEIAVTSTGIKINALFAEEDLEEEVDFSEIKPLPSTYIDSDSAIALMLANGLEDFMNEAKEEFLTLESNYSWNLDLQLLNGYWEYPPDPTPDAPVFWKGSFTSDSYNYALDVSQVASFEIYLDAETGEVLHIDQTDIPDGPEISIVSVYPANGAEAVETDSIVFTFDRPISIEEYILNTMIFDLFYLAPTEKVSINNAQLSNDKTKLTISVSLTEDTDYIGVLTEMYGSDGAYLKHPYVFQFTTADQAGSYSVKGKINATESTTPEFDDLVVMLVKNTPNFGFNIYPQDISSDDIVPLYAANVDPSTGEYEIQGVREGSYFPIAIDISEDDFEVPTNGFYIPEIYYYDGNEDLTPDSIIVNEQTTNSSGELADINLRPLELINFTFKQALEIAEQHLNNNNISYELMGGTVEYDDELFEEIYYFKQKLPLLKKSQNTTFKAKDSLLPASYPDGRNYIWNVYAYNSQDDVFMIILVTPVGAYTGSTITEQEIQAQTGIPVEFDDMKRLPENFIDSDSAAYIIEQNGGADFRMYLDTQYGGSEGGYWWHFQLEALHEFWAFPSSPISSTPITWSGKYYANYFDPVSQTWTEEEDSMIVYLDIETGEILSSISTDAETEETIPETIQLGQNYPNPFNPSTTIPFELSDPAHVTISVFNVLGQKVATITDEMYTAGSHRIRFDASHLSSGVYLYRLQAGNTIQTKKLMLVK